MPSRKPLALTMMLRATTGAVLSLRTSQCFNGTNIVAALVLLPPPIRSKPAIASTFCTAGCSPISLPSSALILRVRSSVAPSGSWTVAKR